jgi:4-amino-4-deoxy-L-arabinose transferase-like glycosyltransferase
VELRLPFAGLVGPATGVWGVIRATNSTASGTWSSDAPARAVDTLARLPLAGIVAIAIVVRVLAGLAFSAADTTTYEFGWIGRNVVDGRGFSYYSDDPVGRLDPEDSELPGDPIPTAYMPPGYTFVATAATWIGDSHVGIVWALRTANALGAAAGVLLMHALARRLVGSRAARLAALGFALYPALVYGATQASSSNVYIPLELGVAVLLLRAAPSGSWRSWALAGASLGVVCLFRAEAVVLVPLATLWLVWSAGRSGAGARRLKLGAVFLCVAVAIPGAWLVRNWAAFGRPVATVAMSGGKNLWIGNHEGATGSQKKFAVPGGLEDEILALEPGDDFEVRVDAIFRREAMESMIGDPFGTVVRDVKKVGLLLGADVYDRRNLNPLYVAPYFAVAVAGLAGFAAWWRRRPAADTVRWLVVGYAGFTVAKAVVFFALARYRLPIEMMLLIFASAWLTDRTAAGEATPRGAEPTADRPLAPAS